MKDAKKEAQNRAADEDMIAGVLDGAELSDAVLQKVSGGAPDQSIIIGITCENRG